MGKSKSVQSLLNLFEILNLNPKLDVIDEEECNSAIMGSSDHEEIAFFESDSSDTFDDNFIEIEPEKTKEPAS